MEWWESCCCCCSCSCLCCCSCCCFCCCCCCCYCCCSLSNSDFATLNISCACFLYYTSTAHTRRFLSPLILFSPAAPDINDAIKTCWEKEKKKRSRKNGKKDLILAGGRRKRGSRLAHFWSRRRERKIKKFRGIPSFPFLFQNTWWKTKIPQICLAFVF